MNELKTLFPDCEMVKIGRVSVKIYPVKLKDLELYSQAAGSIVAFLADTTAIKMVAYGAKNTAQLQRLLRLNTNLSARQIRNLSASDAILLGYQVVRVNFDFFEKALHEVMVSLPDGDTLSSGL